MGIKEVKVLKQIQKELNDQLSRITNLLVEIRDGLSSAMVIEESDILQLPKHLQETLLALTQHGGQATAPQIATATGKARAVESSYLNQLCIYGWCGKRTVGRKKVFYLKRARG